ncbi:hypothetical protein [Sphingobacterium chuzhouense]|uniref:Lipoprotein n=1 Tax=Sphingobacterium chuzhouense TaxID=1742264 RepID=A0ABR7XP70_9SPHI|nr:hypothetical protein [Sphingobacterium chuzhouense]MBD1420960.1 hypothetical protein [Sphingobacterium chuzhouense]
MIRMNVESKKYTMTPAVFNRLNKRSVLSFVFMVLIGSLLLSACSTNDDNEPNETAGSGVRLKHLVTAEQVAASLGESMQGYSLQGTGGFTNTGNYPEVPHVYYYTVYFQKHLHHEQYASRSISAQAGMGKDTKDEILEMFDDIEEVADGRLGKAPYENVFALRYKDNEKRDWRYELYIRLAHINNQDNQVITLSGTFGPSSHPDTEAIAPDPMSGSEAVSAMLTLVEPVSNH